MAKRISLLPIQGSGDTGYDLVTNADGGQEWVQNRPEDPYRVDAPDGGSGVVLGQIGNRALVKHRVPDGTPQRATTLADFTGDGLDVNDAPLTSAQRTALQTFLGNNGVTVDAPTLATLTSRRKVVAFMLGQLGWSAQDFKRLVSDYDVQEA